MKYAINCSILFKELPLLERPAAAKAAGFDAVEFWWPWEVAVPSVAEIDAFVHAIQAADVQLIGLNFFAGNMPGGDRGLVSWIARQKEFRANVPVAVEIGRRLNCLAFNALYGNRQPNEDPILAEQLAVENLRFAAAEAAKIGATVLVEPVSGSPDYPLKTAQQACRVIELAQAEGGAKNLGFLADLYHLAANGDRVETAIINSAQYVAHCQIADNPGRGEPGTGELPLADWLGLLREHGYDSWVALEYNPTVTTVDSFGQLPKLT